MASFFIPLTGLESDSTALNTIANDLANMNTTAYKDQSANFSDLFYQQIGSAGSGDPIQVGAGVQVSSIETAFTQGSLNTTGNATDVALNGNGFFVVNNGSIDDYTRAGNFSLNSGGQLITADGMNVMGYPAVNGVVNTTSPLSPIAIPVGQVEPPQATSSFSMTANLDSAAQLNTSFPAQVTMFDSLGQSYQATVDYTKIGTNSWTYNITVPDTLQASAQPATTVVDAVTQTSTTAAGITTLDYNFATSNGTPGTVDPTTAMTITGPTAALGVNATIAAPAVTPGETVGAYAAALQLAVTAAGITGVNVTSTAGGQLSIVGAGVTAAGAVNQTLAATSTNYNFGSSGGTSTTIDPGTNLSITGLTASGATATIAPPTVTPGETVAAYATAVQAAITAAGIVGVSVTSSGGTLNVTGADMSTTGSMVQDAVASANASGTLTFDSNGNLVSPAADLSGITFGGLSDGAANLNMTWNLLGSNGTPTVSQVDSASAVSAVDANGFASGQYQSFTIGQDGTVKATFSNGQQLAVGQLALANVANVQGMTLLGDGDYATTLASGSAQVGSSGNNGLGTIVDGSLEESNVNISAEFSDLIIAQRAFEANSKAVTTFDTVTQETINMVH
jgi:flagellar hook protein FlgE